MKKKIKKAFTLVELLVVIAILAILATVSIVGYNSFTKKAKVSNDTALVSQLNTLLKADSMVNGDAKTPTDALKITSEAGYDVEKLTPTTNNYEIIWNQAKNEFALLDEKQNVVYGEKNEGTDEYKNWKFVDTYTTIPNYSVYLKGTAFTGTLEVKAGIDVGNNTGISSITYTHTSGDAQEVAIRTNGGTLNVNGIQGDNGDVVNHFNDASYVDVQSVGKNSYHEYGNVGFVNVVNGRVAVEKDAKVLTAYLAETTAKVDNNSGIIENAYAKAGVTNTGNVTVTEVPSGKTIEDIKNEVDEKYNAVAIVNNNYYTSLETAFSYALSFNSATIEILNDINLANKGWNPISIEKNKSLKIIGNGHSINNMLVDGFLRASDGSMEFPSGSAATYACGFIGSNNGSLSIENITFENSYSDIDTSKDTTNTSGSSQIGIVVGVNSGTVLLDNVIVKNSIVKGYTKVGTFVGHATNNSTVTLKHCGLINNKVILEADGKDPDAALAGLIIGYANPKDTNALAAVITIEDGILLQANETIIDDSVKWTGFERYNENGTIYVVSGQVFYLMSNTFVRGNLASGTAKLELNVNGYYYEK